LKKRAVKKWNTFVPSTDLVRLSLEAPFQYLEALLIVALVKDDGTERQSGSFSRLESSS
jgi:hypothetical protein